MRMNEIKFHKGDDLNLLCAVRGVYALAAIDHYSDTAQAPSYKVDPVKLYISKALDLDFNEDISKNRMLSALCKEFKIEIQKFNKELEEKGVVKHVWWWLGDSLEQIVCNHLNNDTPITQETKDALDAKLQMYYNGVMKLIYSPVVPYAPKAEEPEYEYEEIGEYAGERLYRRVKK